MVSNFVHPGDHFKCYTQSERSKNIECKKLADVHCLIPIFASTCSNCTTIPRSNKNFGHNNSNSMGRGCFQSHSIHACKSCKC